MTALKITDLRNCAIHTVPLSFDFAAQPRDWDGEENGWSVAVPAGEQECPKCDGRGEYESGPTGQEVWVDCEKCDGNGHFNPDGDDSDAWEPLVNFAYAIPSLEIPDNWRECLCNMTIVNIDGEPFIAQTGGGMDMSWEICETFIRLGYLPPAHFCELPAMCGRGLSDRDKSIVAACIRSLEIVASRATRGVNWMSELYGVKSAPTNPAARIAAVLWPNGDVDSEWDSGTASDVADVMRSTGNGPS